MEPNKILIVAEEISAVENLAAELSTAGYQVVGKATTGDEAIHLTQQTQPDLILLNLTPDGEISGLQVAEQIRAISEAAIIYFNTKSDDKTRPPAPTPVPPDPIINPVETRALLSAIDTALQKHKLEQISQKRTAQLALLNHISRQIASALNVNEILDRTVHLTHASFNYHQVGIFLLDKAGDALTLKALASDSQAHLVKELRLSLNQGLVGWAGAKGSSVLSNNTLADERFVDFYAAELPTHSELSIPIKMSDQLLGVLDLQSPEQDAFDENGLMVMETLAAQVAIALENARLYQNLRIFFDGIDDLVFVLAEDGRILETNPVAQQRLGYTAAELQSMTILDVHPPEQRQETTLTLAEILQGRAQICCVPLLSKNGELIPVETKVTLGQWGGQNAIFGVSRDISARVQSEAIMQARLRLMEFAATHSMAELLQATLDEAEAITESTIGFYHFVDDDQITLSLQAWSTNTLENMCTAEGAGLHYPIDQAGVWVDGARQRRPVIHNDYASLPHRKGMPEGHAPVIRELVVPVIRNDKLVAILGVGNKPVNYDARDIEMVERLADFAWDIAENKRAEEELRESEANLNKAQKIAHLGSYSWIAEYDHFSWSEEMYQIFGYQPDDPPSLEAILARVHPEDRQRVSEEIEYARDHQDTYEHEYRIMHPNGEIRYVCEQAEVIHNAAGEVVRVFGTVLDITEQKRAENLLYLQRDMALTLSLHSRLEDILQSVLETALQIEEIDCGGVYLVQEETGDLILAEAIGLSQTYLEAVKHFPANSQQAVLVRDGQPIYTNYQMITSPDERTRRGEDLHATAILPVEHMGKIIAVFNLASHTYDELSEISKKTIEALAANLGTMILHVKAEEALQHSEEQFASIFRLSPNPIAIVRLSDGKILNFNEAFLQLSGLDAAQVRQQIWSDKNLIANSWEYEILEKKLAEEGQIVNQEIELVGPTNQNRKVLLTMRTITIREEACLLIIVNDLTERLQAEKRLQQQLEHLAALKTIDQAISNNLALEAIFDTVLDQVQKAIPHAEQAVIHLLDETQNVLFPVAVSEPSSRFSKQLGMRPGDGLAGWVISTGQSINSGDIHQEPKLIPGNISKKVKSLLVVPIQNQDQTLGTISIQSKKLNAFSLDDDHLISLLGIQAALAIKNARLFEREHTSRQQAEILREIARVINSTLDLEKILEIVLNQLQRVLAFDTASIFVWDEDKHLDIYSSLGFQQNETLLKGFEELIVHSPIIARMDRDRQPIVIDDVTGESDWVQLPGTQLVHCWLGVPLVIRDRMVGALMIDRHQPLVFRPTEQHLARTLAQHVCVAIDNAQLYANLQTQIEMLQKTQNYLVQSEKLTALGELVAGVAHELNNPLTSIILLAQLIEQDQLPPSSLANLEKIVSESTRAASIVRGLRDFSRQHPPERRLTQINAVIKSTIELLSYELSTSNIKWVFHLAPDLPMVLVDPNQLQQVFINITNNSRQAMFSVKSGGLLRISTEIANTLQVQTQNTISVIRIRFQDNGPGIPLEIQNRIFDPFFTTKPAGEGTGLGLSICHGIIAEHGGQIKVESEPGNGATFIIELPLKVPDEEHIDIPPQSDEEFILQSQGRVLVLDDEKVVLEVLSSALKRKGFQIEACNTGIDAIEQISKNDYDVVLSDIRMPGMSGLEIYRRAVSLKPKLAQKFIFITGDVLNQETRDFLKGTGVSYLSKPFDFSELIKAVLAVSEAVRTQT